MLQGNDHATFELETPETFDTIIIQNGAGGQENKIKGFKVKVKMNNWKTTFEELEVKRDSGAQAAQDGSISLSRDQEYLQITFKEPAKKVTAIFIELVQTTDKEAIINDVLIPREFTNDTT